MPSKHPVNFRKLEYSPLQNPLVQGNTIRTKNKLISTGVQAGNLVDSETGELKALTMIHEIHEKDEEHFVKIFAEGVKAAFDLNRTANRVFQAVLKAYQTEKLTGGYADCVTLFWFDDGLNGAKIGMSEATFHRGLKELIAKEFLSPKMPNVYWVNPALFFKGDRVAFVKEYRRLASEQPVLEACPDVEPS